MGQPRKTSDIPPGQEDPLSFALSRRDARTLDMVREAIHHKQVLLAYQPVVRATDMRTPVFHEALLRVLDETGRIIPAREFMSTVEDNELGRQLDCLSLEFGLATLAAHPDLKLSINMSARSIGYGQWLKTLNSKTKTRPDVAERLILEISEPSAMQVPELVVDFMDDLKARGISFALDDFASGFTNFRYFREFFFDILKLDGQFTRNIHADTENQAIAGALASMARKLDMFTVASRVEHPEDATTLAALGFDCLQGFLFGAPTVSPSWKSKK